MKQYKLSNSKLGLFKNCPRCFWIANNMKVGQPRGISSSLPTGVDGILKEIYDNRRKDTSRKGTEYGLPEGAILYQNVSLLDEMRDWRRGIKVTLNINGCEVIMSGAIDDLLYFPSTDSYAVYDFKTKGSEPDVDYGVRYYQEQVDIYGLFIEKKLGKLEPKGYLNYYWPVQVGDTLTFKEKLLIMDVSPTRALAFIAKGIECLEGPMPDHDPANECEYCKYIAKIQRIGK